MKIAVSATGPSMDSTVDPRFGRADYLLIIETDNMALVKVIDNRASQNAAHGAGINAASMVVDAGAQAVLTGQVGPKAFGVLNAAGVNVVSEMSGTVRDAVERFKQNPLSTSSSSDSGGSGNVYRADRGGVSGGFGRCRAQGGLGMGRGGGAGGRGRGCCAAIMAGIGGAFRSMGKRLGLNLRTRARNLSCMNRSGRRFMRMRAERRMAL